MTHTTKEQKNSKKNSAFVVFIIRMIYVCRQYIHNVVYKLS